MDNTLLEAQTLIQDIYSEVIEEETHLAGGRKLGRGGSAFHDLNESQVSFGFPNDRLIRLTPDLLQKMDIELHLIQAEQIASQYDFYYMAMPVSLYPKRGQLFNRVECHLAFKAEPNQDVIVQNIFPTSQWHPVLAWGGGMNLALNGKLDWEIGVDETQLETVKQLPGVPIGSIKTNNEIQSRILMPDFSFELGRQEIVATGQGQNFCRWRLRDPQLKQINDLRFIVIFKVTQGTRTIRMLGQVQAEPDMAYLAGEIDDVFSELSQRVKDIFRKPDTARTGVERLPVGDYEVWESLTLP